MKDGNNRVIRLGTRKSRLAMAQTMLAAEAMKREEPGLSVELVPLMTAGDRILDRSLVEFGGKGAFVMEFESAILEGRIDAAVHSAKDMPERLADGLSIAAVLPREAAGDVLVTVKGRDPASRPMVVGTGSLRRQVQLAEKRSAVCKPLRGNVNTRLEKLWDGEYDGIILAAAGLKRLGLFEDERFSFEALPEREFIPAGGQAIIAVESRADSEFLELFGKINDRTSELCLATEREALKLLGAGCHSAVGVYSFVEEERLFARLMVYKEQKITRREAAGRPEEYLALAARLTEGLKL